MPEESKTAGAPEEKAAQPATKAKKEKPPAVEDKPFADFITQDFVPNLEQTLGNVGIRDAEVTFAELPLPVSGVSDVKCWQVIGKFRGGQRQFRVGFLKEDIKGQKVFCCADNGAMPSLLESFMIDERKVTLDLLVLYTIQRLNGQKWLSGN